jgi:hypothetical protein
VVTLTSPGDNSATNNTTVTFNGRADTTAGNVTVTITGPGAPGPLTATPDGTTGAWSVNAVLSEGTYTAQASQTNASAETGTSGLAHTFRVDTTPPANVTLAAQPALSNNPTPTFSGTAGNATGDSPTVAVKIYAGSTASGSPVRTLSASRSGGNWAISAGSPLADGTYTAQAEQADDAGNPITKSGTSTFAIDATSPVVTLAAPADGSSTNNTTPPFSGSAGTAGGDSSTVTVEIYAGTGIAGSPTAVNADGSSGSWVTAAGLAQGTYTARARQSDAAGNTGFSAPHTFTIDTSPPGVVIISGPSGTVASTSATFTYVATEAAKFECRLDGGAYLPCGSSVTYSNLAKGPHTFDVRATDLAGNTNPASAIANWRVDTSTPAVSLIRPFPIVRIAGRLTRKGVSLTAFEVVAVPGARIEVSCKGGGCPVRRTTRTVSTRSTSGKALAANRVRFTSFRRLNAGAVLEVRITKSGAIGKYTRFVIRKKKLPSRSDACLMPGQGKPVICPS